MTKMKCRQCEHFEECRSKNIILDVTTSDDNWQNPWEHVYVFGLNKEVPSYCHYEKESLDWINRVIIEDTKMNKKEFYPNANWIPCSEKLPEVGNTDYLATVDYGEFGVAVGQRFFYNKEIGWDDYAVVAWMPLPQPWKGEE